MKHKFNDDFYARTVEDWENEQVPSRCVTDNIGWSFRLLPVALAVGAVVPANWKVWICIVAVTYVFVLLFTFLEEINENIRFVRHQNRAFREGVRDSCRSMATYNSAVTAVDVISNIDSYWDYPSK